MWHGWQEPPAYAVSEFFLDFDGSALEAFDQDSLL